MFNSKKENIKLLLSLRQIRTTLIDKTFLLFHIKVIFKFSYGKKMLRNH